MSAMGLSEPNPSGSATDQQPAVCVQCGRISDPFWSGWFAYRVDDPETDSVPELGFFCPDCAGREFGRRRA